LTIYIRFWRHYSKTKSRGTMHDGVSESIPPLSPEVETSGNLKEMWVKTHLRLKFAIESIRESSILDRVGG
jgi:hypothetical protein